MGFNFFLILTPSHWINTLDLTMTHPKLFMVVSAILLYSSLSLYSQRNFQSGYYITIEQDTVLGEIDNRGDLKNGNICAFRKNENAEIKEFKPTEITAYRFLEGKFYTSIVLPVDGEFVMVFAEYLVNGISDLLYHRSLNSDHYYIETNKGEWLELSNDDIVFKKEGVTYSKESNQYIGLMKANFMDCSEIQEQIGGAKFTHKSLIKLTSQYHDYVCTDGEECIIYEKAPPIVTLSLAPILGFSLNGIAIPSHPDYENHSFDKSNDLSFGLQLQATLPRLNDKLSLLLKTEYSESYFFSNLTTSLNAYATEYSDVHVHRKFLSNMLGIQYVFLKGKIRPSFAFGPELNYSFDLDIREIAENVTATEVRTYETQGRLPHYVAYGAFAQAGLEFKINSRQRLFLQLRYSFTKGVTELVMDGTVDMSYGTYPMYLQGFTVNLGYFFF